MMSIVLTDTPAPDSFSLEESLLGSGESPPGRTSAPHEDPWAKYLDPWCLVDPWTEQMVKGAVGVSRAAARTPSPPQTPLIAETLIVHGLAEMRERAHRISCREENS